MAQLSSTTTAISTSTMASVGESTSITSYLTAVATPYSDAGTATPSATQTPVALKNEGRDNGLGRSAKVALGVGFGIGTPLLMLLVAFLFLVRRRKQIQVQVEAKYAQQAQSDLSMGGTPYYVPTGLPRTDDAHQLDAVQHGRGYDEHSPPLQDTLKGPVRAVIQEDPLAHSARQSLQIPLALLIPDSDIGSVRSKGLSPVSGGSPVSPVSPMSAITPAVSRPPYPTMK